MLFACATADEFFRSRVDHMIEPRPPLAVLTSRQTAAQRGRLSVRVNQGQGVLQIRWSEAGAALTEHLHADCRRHGCRIPIHRSIHRAP